MNIEPKIIFDDSCMLALNKPALTHSVSIQKSAESIAAWIVARYPELEFASANPLDGGLINRLDYETSGILIAGKNRACWLALREQFEKGTISKRYHAIIQGVLDSPLSVEGYISSRYRGSKKVQLTAHEVKRSLYTRSQISRSISVSPDGAHSRVTIDAETGARHQVRAHCASTGHALAGDLLYGGSRFHHRLGLPPFVLHAASASLTHPGSGSKLELKAADPEYLESLLMTQL